MSMADARTREVRERGDFIQQMIVDEAQLNGLTPHETAGILLDLVAKFVAIDVAGPLPKCHEYLDRWVEKYSVAKL
jgi:hypothetical protein